MFRALRILPVLAVLGGIALVGKAGGILVSLDGPDVKRAESAPPSRFSRGLAAFQPINQQAPDMHPAAEAEPQAEPAREVAEAALVLPNSPEARLAPAAGSEPEGEPETESGSAESAALDQEADLGTVPLSAPVRDPFDMSDEELELLQRLVERREALAERSRMLDQRAALLEATEARIADKMNELKQLQAVIEDLLAQYDEEEEARLQSLVKIYESMKPKEAARIFEELDILVLLDVIGRMKERKSAPILAKMNPKKAKTVTLELAQRRSMPFARE